MTTYKNIQEISPAGEVYITRTAEKILAATDWTQLDDSGLTDSCKTAFATYRAAIRTIRQTNPDSPTWPDAPAEDFS